MHPEHIWKLIENCLTGKGLSKRYKLPKSVSHFRFFNTSLTFEEKIRLLSKVIAEQINMKTFKKECFFLIQQKNVRLRILQDLGGNFVTFKEAQCTFPLLLQQQRIDEWTLAFSKCKEGTTPLGWKDFINVIKDEVNIAQATTTKSVHLKCGNCTYYTMHNQKYQALTAEYGDRSLFVGLYFNNNT